MTLIPKGGEARANLPDKTPRYLHNTPDDEVRMRRLQLQENIAHGDGSAGRFVCRIGGTNPSSGHLGQHSVWLKMPVICEDLCR